MKDAPLDVTFAGCAAVVARGDGIVCELADSRSVRLVVPQRDVTVLLARRGGPAEPEPLASRYELVDQAHALHVDVPLDAEQIVVRARVGDARQPASFTLKVATARKIAWVDEAKALRAKNDVAAARGLAQAHVDAGDEVERTAAKDLLARITLSEGHAEEAFPLFRAAIDAHRGARRISEEIDDSFALAFALHQRSHRYDEARAALDAVARDLRGYPEGGARDPYYRGILASETGDPRNALWLLREAEGRANRLGMSRLARNARAARALELQKLGRFRDSVTILEALDRDPDVKGCERVEIANDLGWGILLANEATPGRPDEARGDPRPMLQRALEDPKCSDAYLRSFALGNLARFDIGAGHADDARQHLAEARKAVAEPRGTERLAWLDLEARILLANHEPAKALARFDEERALARAAFLLDAEWSALVGRADALEALDRRPDAAAAWNAAEDVLDRAVLLVPLGEGRGSFVAERSRSARSAIELLVALGRHAEAARVARRSRRRVLAGVERASRVELLSPSERTRWEAAVRSFRSAREALDAEAANDWKLPADALARAIEARKEREQAVRIAFEAAMSVLAPASASSGAALDPKLAPGDLELVIHPVRKDWIALATDASGTTAHHLPDPSSPARELAAALLEPIAARVLAARRVRVRAYGRALAVDVHALELRGVPLLEQVAVDYPLGLHGAPGEAGFQRRALVVGDPTENLGGARAEAKLVADALHGRMPSKVLMGADATSKAVAADLARAGLFHYAGHAFAGGHDGWSAYLALAGGGNLTVADFLALAPAPHKAVLLGCDAGTTFGEEEGIGLARALVAAGTEEVLAPVGRVPDALAKEVAEALYAGAAADALLDLDASGSLASAARLALKTVRARDPGGRWAAFRVIAR